MGEPRIVEAVMTSAAAGGLMAGPEGSRISLARWLSRAIEDAMAQAVREVQAESEALGARTDMSAEDKAAALERLNAPDNVRARMLAGRQRVKDVLAAYELAAAQAAAQEAALQRE